MTNITYNVRLVNKQTGVMHPAEITAPPDPASAVNAAYERWGLTHKIITVYPRSGAWALNWPPDPMAAVAKEPN